jgi:sigma-B regulation protein RsbU (phosphoserine phosphatase)
MAHSTSFSGRARKRYSRLGRFFRDYTAGLSGAELRRLFEKDAAEAYAVLTRDQEVAGSSSDRVKSFLVGVRVFFLGLSYKLTPARRMLFAGSLIAALLGFLPATADVSADGVYLDFSPFWFVLSVGGLVYLLALELVDRVRVRDELEVARKLQRDLLPSESLSVPGYRAAHSYRTANEVGGDYYQFVVLPSGRIALMVGDASGHGMAAGLLMALADATIRTALDLDPEPGRVVEIVNRALCRTGGRRAFFSLFYALMDPEAGRLDYVCAGHPFPLLRRADGRVEELGRGGLPLGLRPELEPVAGSARLEPGDLLVLYTDGLAEAQNPDQEDFGFDRIRQVVAGGGAAQTVHDALVHAFDRHRSEAALTDDVTLAVLERLPRVPVASSSTD